MKQSRGFQRAINLKAIWYVAGVVGGICGVVFAVKLAPIMSVAFAGPGILAANRLWRIRAGNSDLPELDHVMPVLSAGVLLSLLIVWWRPIPFVGSAIAVGLISVLAIGSVLDAWRSRSLRPSETPFSRVVWDRLLRNWTLATGLLAATIASAFWPATTGSTDGRLEGVVSLAAVSVAALSIDSPKWVVPSPRSLIGSALFVGVAVLAGAGQLAEHPEISLAAIAIGLIQVARLASTASSTPAAASSAAEPSTLPVALQSAVMQTLLATGVVVALMADWALRHPT